MSVSPPIDLSVRVGGMTLRNPVMPASGTFAEGLDRVMDFNRLGAIVTKTITREIRAGNPLPRVVERPGSMINAIGIPSRGVPYFIENTMPHYAHYDTPLVVSISAATAEGFASLATELSIPGIAAIEANISCPNIEEDGKAFAMRAESTENVTRQLRAATDLPLWVKLTPNTGDTAEVARAAEAAGADAVVVANTILSMAVDLKTFRPCLGNVMGGLSGPAIKPIILRQVFQCAKGGRHPGHRLRRHLHRGGRGGVHAGRGERRSGRCGDIHPVGGDDHDNRRHREFLSLTRDQAGCRPHRRGAGRGSRRARYLMAGSDIMTVPITKVLPAIHDAGDCALAEELFAILREKTGDGVGITRESYGERDAGANLVVTLGGEPDLPFVACGSHLDSVPKGGNFDGAAGVIAGLAILARFKEEGFRPRRTVKLYALRGEESARFGRAYMGSSALFGALKPADLAVKCEMTGRTLAECMRDVGVDVDRVERGEPLLDTKRVAGWIELHIEQGPVLVARELPIGIVTGIRGNIRHRAVECVGEVGHSGAIPRWLRHDAVFAAAELVTHLDRHRRTLLERGRDVVVTCGVFGTDPQEYAIARIPGTVRFSFEVRSQSQRTIDAFYDLFLSECVWSARSAAWNSGWIASWRPHRQAWTMSGSIASKGRPAISVCRTKKFQAEPDMIRRYLPMPVFRAP